MSVIDLKDERFAKLHDKLQSCLDDEEEVFVFDHAEGSSSTPLTTRTAIINWDSDQFLVIQSHNGLGEESEPSVIRLPHAAVKFMCSDILERSIHATGFRVGPNGDPKRLRHLDWATE